MCASLYYLTTKATSYLRQPVVQDTKAKLIADREAFWRLDIAHNVSNKGKKTTPLAQVQVGVYTQYCG